MKLTISFNPKLILSSTFTAALISIIYRLYLRSYFCTSHSFTLFDNILND